MKFIKLPLWILLLWTLESGSQIIEIPLDFEETPTTHDCFIPYCRMKPPRIALALSGGGARGLAQIGVLKVFERYGIPVDGIAGTSMGAIIGGLYAIGYTAHDLDSLAKTIAWDRILHDTPPRQQLFLAEKTEHTRHLLQLRFKGFSPDIQGAFTSGIQFNQILTDLIWKAPAPVDQHFDHLVIPFRAVSTDLLTGDKVVITQGSLIETLRASMAIPLLFTPVKKDGAWLVDGGLVQNLPVSEAREMGCDLVIAVDTSSKLRTPEFLNAPWEIADQVTTIMAQESVRTQYHLADIGIAPALDDLANTDFSHIDALIEAGETAAEAVIPLIDSLLTLHLSGESDVYYPVQRIQVTGCRLMSEASALDILDLNPKEPISLSDIKWAAAKLYQTGTITKIQASADTGLQLLQFEITETPFIENILIQGNQQFSDSLLFSLMETSAGQQLEIPKCRRDMRRLLAHYQKAGFIQARIRSASLCDGVLSLELDEGRMDEIWIRGHQITKPFVILRELVVSQGDLFNINVVNQSIQNIHSTGYFEDVRYELVPVNENYRLIFRVSEHQYTLARTGIRYDLERQTRGFIELVQDNIWGIGAEGSFTGLLGPKDRMLKSVLRADRLYTSYLTSKIEIGYNYSNYQYYQNHKRLGEYAISRLYGSCSAGRQMQRLGTVSVEISSEGYLIQADTMLVVAPDRKFFQTVRIHSEVDTRDKMPFPTEGKYHYLEYETSARFLGSESNFIRLSSRMESFYPILKNLVFHPRFFWGTASLDTPFPKHYRMGGLNDFMGLADDALIGKRSLLLSGELRTLLPCKRLCEAYLSIRFDFGGIWNKYSKINYQDFKQGIGTILSIKTILGPLYVGSGRTNEGKHHYYFSFGHDF